MAIISSVLTLVGFASSPTATIAALALLGLAVSPSSGSERAAPVAAEPPKTSEILQVHPLQLADFAAFAMNGTQLLLGRETLNSRDAKLLTVLSGLKENFKNLTLVEGHVDQWPPLSQDALTSLANGKTGKA